MQSKEHKPLPSNASFKDDLLPETQENNNPSAANEISTAKDVSSKLGLNY